MAKKKKTSNPLTTILIIFLSLFVLSSIFASIISLAFMEETVNGNVAVIPVKGAILGDGGGVFDDTSASASIIVDLLERANQDESIQAIVLEINSPGGSAVASEEIANAVKRVNKTTVAWIREAGASGGYWIASASDHIIASRMSITGSIGVVSSYLDFSEFIEEHNVSYQRLVFGKYKDAGSPFRELTYQEEALFQKKIDRIGEIFIEEVAENRNMSFDDVSVHAHGMFLLGEEAYDANLIDELGGEREVTLYLEKELNQSVTYETFSPQVTWVDVLAGVLVDHGFAVGEGLGSSLGVDTQTRVRV